jgi:hypothetical protein
LRNRSGRRDEEIARISRECGAAEKRKPPLDRRDVTVGAIYLRKNGTPRERRGNPADETDDRPRRFVQTRRRGRYGNVLHVLHGRM